MDAGPMWVWTARWTPLPITRRRSGRFIRTDAWPRGAIFDQQVIDARLRRAMAAVSPRLDTQTPGAGNGRRPTSNSCRSAGALLADSDAIARCLALVERAGRFCLDKRCSAIAQNTSRAPRGRDPIRAVGVAVAATKTRRRTSAQRSTPYRYALGKRRSGLRCCFVRDVGILHPRSGQALRGDRG